MDISIHNIDYFSSMSSKVYIIYIHTYIYICIHIYVLSNLCHAIRKLAEISPPLRNQMLYRGVRGDLPRTFWEEDEQGMICAVDGGFASTSKKSLTVEKYLGRGSNIMWEIKTEPESDAGYHCGADVSKLSQVFLKIFEITLDY